MNLKLEQLLLHIIMFLSIKLCSQGQVILEKTKSILIVPESLENCIENKKCWASTHPQQKKISAASISFSLTFLHHRISCWLSCLLFVCWMLMGRLFCFEIGSWCLSSILFWLTLVFLWWTGGEVAFWVRPEVWWADHFWFEIRSQFFGLSLVLAFFIGVLSVDWRLCGGGCWLIFKIGVIRMWLSFGDEDCGFFYKGVLLGWVVAMGVMDVVFFQWLVALGVDVYFSGCCHYRRWSQGSLCRCLFSGVPPIYDALCLYFLKHWSLFVLCRDQVFNKILLIQKKKLITIITWNEITNIHY